MKFFANKVLKTINKQWSNYIIYGKEIKLSFLVLRVSCKHSFTFFSLMINDVTFCIQSIGFLLSNVRIRGV